MYTFEDIEKCPLDEKYTDTYLQELFKVFELPPMLPLPKNATISYLIMYILSITPSNDYKNTLDYQLAHSTKEKALAAFTYTGPDIRKDKILGAWLDVTKDMSKIEKALLGWPK